MSNRRHGHWSKNYGNQHGMDNHTLDHITQYLSGGLSPQEQAVFAEKMEGEPTFAEAVAEMQAIKRIVAVNGDAQFLARLDEIDHQLTSGGVTEGKLKRIRWVSWTVAAAIVVLLSIWAIFQSAKTPITNEALFVTHFTPYKAPQPTRSDGQQLTTFQKAWQAFEAKEYAEASVLLQTLASNGDERSYLADFYAGQCFLMLQPPAPEQAIAAFERVLLTDHDYRAQTEWYLALAYLKADDLPNAHLHLQEIASTEGHFYQQKAQSVLDKL